MADETAKRDPGGYHFYSLRFSRCFQFRHGIWKQKREGVGFSCLMVARPDDLQMTQVRFDGGFPEIQKNPLNETIPQDKRRNAKRNGANRNAATARLARDVATRQVKIEP